MFGCPVSLQTSSGLILFSTVRTYNNFRVILQNKTKVKTFATGKLASLKRSKTRKEKVVSRYEAAGVSIKPLSRNLCIMY